MKRGILVKKKIIYLYSALFIYLLMGIIFVISRSNSYYSTLIIEKDVFFENKSYWEDRCVPENNKQSIIYGTPGAKWCLDGFGNFRTEKPSRVKWFYHFYTKKPMDILLLIFFWPIHFLGFDLIHFKSVAAVWQFG